MKKITVYIDNGHGQDTLGKCSPDKTLCEWKWTREVAAMIVAELKRVGIDAHLLTPELNDVSLPERVRRINNVCKVRGAANVLLISVHVDAAGNEGKWLDAGGWSAYTTKGTTKSDTVAEYLYKAAEKYLAKYAENMEKGKLTGMYGKKQRPFRTDKTDGDMDMEANYYILKNSNCPAVLTENLFQDNRQDVAFLLSDEGKKTIVDLHVEGIKNYLT